MAVVPKCPLFGELTVIWSGLSSGVKAKTPTSYEKLNEMRSLHLDLAPYEKWDEMLALRQSASFSSHFFVGGGVKALDNTRALIV